MSNLLQCLIWSFLNKTKRMVLFMLAGCFSLVAMSYPVNHGMNSFPVGFSNPHLNLQQTIKGTVTDENGEPIAGATISLKGSMTATTTDEFGNYSIIVPDGKAILVFSSVGYVSIEEVVGTQTKIDIQLSEKVDVLDEVVLVGFGTQKKASIVGAITTIEPQQLKIGSSRAMSNVLSGQLAGIIGTQRQGAPGSDGSAFWIRGITTWGGARSPLILVDGVERNLDDMDPEEIESFSILKDAAASAVYGVRGANGVILVNTRRGKVGKPIVTARLERGLNMLGDLPNFIGAAEYMELLNEIKRDRGATPTYSEERIANTRNGSDPDLYPDVNWLKEITKDYGTNTRANLSVTGGTEMLRYALVTSYFGESSIFARDPEQEWDSSNWLKRYNVRSNVDVNLSPTTTLRVGIGGYLQDNNKQPESNAVIFQEAFTIVPHIHPTRYSTGEIPVTPARSNPWALLTQRGFERGSAGKIESLASLEQKMDALIPGLKGRLLFSFDRYNNSWVRRTKNPDWYNPATGRDEEGNLILTIGSYGQEFLGYEPGSSWGYKSTYLESALDYSQRYGKHEVDAMLLYNHRNYDDGSAIPYRHQGLAGRFSYNFGRRYIGEFNFGYNGSENFSKGKRFGFFPSVALGWFVSEEPFMENVRKSLSHLKLRGSWGMTGNDRLDGRRFAYLSTINGHAGYVFGQFGDFGRGGWREGDYGNPNLTWETVEKANLGLEVGLFNAIMIQADVFQEVRRDIFMQRLTIPASAGYNVNPWANFGSMRNRGVEFMVDGNKRVNDHFAFSVRGTFTYAVNKVLEADEPPAIIGTNRAYTGNPTGQIFGMIAEGLLTEDDFNADGTLKGPPQLFGVVRPGDIKYKDVNGDGVVDWQDRSPIGGTVDPQLVYGLGATFNYKWVDFGFFFQGMGKTYRVIGGANFIPGSADGAMGNIYDNYNDRWTVDNPSQDVFWPRLSDYQNANNNVASTWWLRDMSLIRLRQVELGLTIPESLVKRTGLLKGTRLFVRGNNLLRFSEFDMWDPEVGSNNGLIYPLPKTVLFGLELNFR
jgi:TonB-linked SusC/RagA family outer membrane protein